MKKYFGFVKKVFGFGKKNLCIGIAFLVVVGLLSLFVFSGAREGFVGETLGALSADSIKTLSASDVPALTTDSIKTLSASDVAALSSSKSAVTVSALSAGKSAVTVSNTAKLKAGAGVGGASAAYAAGIIPTKPNVPQNKPPPPAKI